MKKWEYKIVIQKIKGFSEVSMKEFNQMLNTMGEEGWNLITVVPVIKVE